jgi:hypothetical protein
MKSVSLTLKEYLTLDLETREALNIATEKVIKEKYPTFIGS